MERDEALAIVQGMSEAQREAVSVLVRESGPIYEIPDELLPYRFPGPLSEAAKAMGFKDCRFEPVPHEHTSGMWACMICGHGDVDRAKCCKCEPSRVADGDLCDE